MVGGAKVFFFYPITNRRFFSGVGGGGEGVGACIVFWFFVFCSDLELYIAI